MKKLFLISTIAGIGFLAGCQQIQDTAQNLRQQGEKAYNGISQQAENVKTSVLQTKQQIDEKSQQLINTVDSINKLAK